MRMVRKADNVDLSEVMAPRHALVSGGRGNFPDVTAGGVRGRASSRILIRRLESGRRKTGSKLEVSTPDEINDVKKENPHESTDIHLSFLCIDSAWQPIAPAACWRHHQRFAICLSC